MEVDTILIAEQALGTRPKLSNYGSILSVFDVDETIFSTTAKILVKDKNTDEVIKMLTNQEFNTYQIQDGQYFDFSEFGNKDKMENEGTYIPYTLGILKQRLMANNVKIAVITARSSNEIADSIEYLLNKVVVQQMMKDAKQYNQQALHDRLVQYFNQNEKFIDRQDIIAVNAPNTEFTGSTSEKKLQAFDMLTKKDGQPIYDLVEFFDDDEANIIAFNDWGDNQSFDTYGQLIKGHYTPEYDGEKREIRLGEAVDFKKKAPRNYFGNDFERIKKENPFISINYKNKKYKLPSQKVFWDNYNNKQNIVMNDGNATFYFQQITQDDNGNLIANKVVKKK